MEPSSHYSFRITARLLNVHPSLAALLRWIPYLPIEFRKKLLSACRMGISLEDNQAILEAVRDYFSVTNIRTQPPPPLEPIRKQAFLYEWENVYRSPLLRSVLSMALRSFPELGDVSAPEVFRKRVMKEIEASQNVWSYEQLFNYSAFFNHMSSARMSVEQPLRPSWRNVSRRFASSLIERIMKEVDHVIFPVVQRKKSMSRETQGLLVQAGYCSDLPRNSLRTLDLEIHNYRTGERILGECEMRSTWGFNILEPRAYYCTGGTQYWSSRYVKRLAVLMMESSQVTSLKRRLNPFDYTTLTPEQHLTLWDLSNFTTTLSELRYFLWYTARFLDEYPQIHQSPLLTLDYAQGIVPIQIPALLDEYNETANYFPNFSIFRIIDKLLLDDSMSDLVSVNSGLLGVHGNIGFSTTLHGLVALAACGDPNCATCVGDDAYAATDLPPDEGLLPMVQRLGSIQTEKFERSGPMSEGDAPFVNKFLKRPIVRDYHGLFHEFSFTFPIMAIAYSDIPPERTYFGDLDESSIVHKLTTQTGAFLWQVYEHAELVDQDSLLVCLEILKKVYQDRHIPLRGCLPYQAKCIDGSIIRWSVPPVIPDLDVFDPRYQDWSEFLWDDRRERYFSMPYGVTSAIRMQPNPDDEFEATSSPLLQALEDIGAIEKKGAVMVTVDAELADNRRMYLDLTRGRRRTVYSYVVRDLNVPWLGDVYSTVYKSGPSGGLVLQRQYLEAL